MVEESKDKKNKKYLKNKFVLLDILNKINFYSWIGTIIVLILMLSSTYIFKISWDNPAINIMMWLLLIGILVVNISWFLARQTRDEINKNKK